VRRMGRIGFLRAVTCASVFAAATSAAGAPTLTWTVRLESKLFIAPIPPANCATSGFTVLKLPAGPLNPLQQASLGAFYTFCLATSVATSDTAATGAIVVPLDARIRGGADVRFSCTAGTAVPVAPEGLTALQLANGNEGPGGLLQGVANPTALRDNLLASGNYGWVVSGHPNPKVEPSFAVFIGAIARPAVDIWNHFSGTITCGVDSRGLPMFTNTGSLVQTSFPSHRVWQSIPPVPAAAPVAPPIVYVPQGSFAGLWSLPAVPAP